jgi:ribosomal-protein-alanine N-acetyltransferase
MLNLNFNPFPVLSTNRLQLRTVTPEDANEVFILRSDPTILKYIKKDPAKDLTDALAFIQKIKGQEQRGECITWAMVPKGEQKLIGSICYWNIEPENHKAEIGYSLFPSSYGKGFMQETFAAILDFGFERMKLKCIDAYTNKNNEASLNLLKRNGFARNIPFENEFVDKEELEYNVVYTLNRN